MSKRRLTFENEGFYHLYNRGVNREKIFFDNENYLFFIRNLRRYLVPVMDIIAYCLMPTHYHLLVCVGSADNDIEGPIQKYCPAARSMQRFSISYTKAINKRYDRVGALFQGAYKAKYINNLDHSRRIIPYIHQNPVSAELVQNATDWKYSSARVYEGIEEPGFLKPLI